MSFKSSEIKTVFGKCRCCLNYGYLKNMWEEHWWQGEKEIYGEMLVQCFGLSWKHSYRSKKRDQICEKCISQLRDANDLKKTMLETMEKQDEEAKIEENIEIVDDSHQERFENEASTNCSVYIDDPDDGDISNDLDYEEVEYLELGDDKEALAAEGEVDVKIEIVDESHQERSEIEALPTSSVDVNDPDDPDYVDLDDPNDSNVSNDMDDEKVEYLELEDKEEALAVEENVITETTSSRGTETPPRRKRARRKVAADGKKTQVDRPKIYKQYTEEDLWKCLEAVRNEEMTPKEASEKYNIPRKTILFKINLESKGKKETPTSNMIKINTESMCQMIHELKKILTYTNATPYKYTAQMYRCFYCCMDAPLFKKPDELRAHTSTKHIADRTMRIEFALRPHGLNEIVKLDIENFTCNACCIPIPTWNDMFRHLKEWHDIVLDVAYTRIVPYELSDEHKCALCKEDFPSYMKLDGHMNAHYNNYVCVECGATFLSVKRLTHHNKHHKIGKYKCTLCSKVFKLQMYRQKHIDLFHNKKTDTFKCGYCEEGFSGVYLRHLHVVDKHKERVKVFTCEVCGQSFTWRPYFVKHMKRKHSDAPKIYKYKCQECDKQFCHLWMLRQHMPKHTGLKKYKCQFCDKAYASWNSRKYHYNACHKEEINE